MSLAVEASTLEFIECLLREIQCFSYVIKMYFDVFNTFDFIAMYLFYGYSNRCDFCFKFIPNTYGIIIIYLNHINTQKRVSNIQKKVFLFIFKCQYTFERRHHSNLRASSSHEVCSCMVLRICQEHQY